MGKTLIAPYHVWFEFVGSDGHKYETTFSWFVRTTVHHTGHGTPSDANLRKFVRHYEQSTQAGGCNAHIGPIDITKACIRRNDADGNLMAVYGTGTFSQKV